MFVLVASLIILELTQFINSVDKNKIKVLHSPIIPLDVRKAVVIGLVLVLVLISNVRNVGRDINYKLTQNVNHLVIIQNY